MRNSCVGFVYVARETGTQRFKIGWTTRRPDERLRELQTGNSDRLVLEGCVLAEPHVEKNLHQWFDTQRVDGEFFVLEDDDVRNILDRTWRVDRGLHDESGPNRRPPWEVAGVETDEDWELWAEQGFPLDFK